MRYGQDGTPLVVLAGKEYGSGSSRDWAAKGPYLQGIKVVIAESFERIHRSNLVGMGILPLQFLPGESVSSLGLTGRETLDFEGVAAAIASSFSGGREISVQATADDGQITPFRTLVRIDTPQEVLYYRHGGILRYVLRQLLGRAQQPQAISASAQAPAPSRERGREDKVEAGSIESFPASDSPAY